MQALLARLPAQDLYSSPATFLIHPIERPRYHEIEQCRACGNPNLVPVLSLGEQSLTGVFPRGLQAAPSKGPLELVACAASNGSAACGLVQLCQSYDPSEMYGENYGYCSSSDGANVQHLKRTVHHLIERYPLQEGDLVLDIGSNDGTLLSFYPEQNVTVVGIDPIGGKFASSYREDIKVVPDFFSADLFREKFEERKVRIVTSMAMFNRLESPLKFMQEVASILDDEGVWHFEMSYMPAMVRTMGYDTICHEHLEYYSLGQLKWMTDRSGLKIVELAGHETNRGRIAVTVARCSSSHPENLTQVEKLLREEETEGLSTLDQQRAFETSVERHKTELLWLLHALKSEGHSVLGYGTSTSGNVLLQHCGITRDLLPAIAEANEDKFGCYTPGTNIPIIPETEAHAMCPDYLLVLPWQAREGIMQREAAFLERGGKMIFPLPSVEIIG